ncbi:aminotransferase class V-fold PLP-dependent enzyme [Helicobacter saguini]|uniref:Aminotransferase class V-fold PLP-dependent enzyme n=1 Tax=Helicobacter saguini TaxID=1548018 RepID=A0A347VPS9_9HELI|nr:aminotransferase class V-fold PLP-dependent enzyme [Helicobacter saguini]MWV61230.1 aminotransferase class V-fold PLP-dependent enzyme [Helicobacter saguini]MWV68103.1 aminotransferase class V-fold PLP-dependent enzyme [Helicobacter saguini]MWV70433.1 aminotransferase class V-fold PLP-dependent enzyme [Helicobacter saguini]MWV72334.1 aminotransferase class V-fold PLP-dependent enzyme [Helicobacter saguini]TLD92985.1 aminotransferase class V-fold PLP-dependent enzyme [Helicobacter saguini]
MANLKHSNFTQNTLALHAGYNYDSQRTLSVPIYQSSAYNFENLDVAANRFALKELGNIYSRVGNPTVAVLQTRLAEVEGGGFAVLAATGAAAIFYAIVNLAEAGDNIVYSNKIYGGTQVLFAHTLKRFGIEARVFDIDNISSLEKVIDKKTKAIFFESLSNPQIAIADTSAITKIAKKHGIISICDNTVATPFLHKPFDFGVDISVHSLTKYVNGQGSAMGGGIIERKGLNELIRGNKRYPAFNTPDESYHGIVYAELGELPSYGIRLITEWLRNIGASISPFNAWLLIQGLETLELRIKQHSDSALEIAKFLESNKKIKSVFYPGLKSNPYNKLLKKYFANSRASGLLSFEAESFEAAQKICNNTELFSITANIGDSKSLIIHPYSTTHSQLSKAEMDSAGITPSTVRLSIGLESPSDLIKDLERTI